MIHKLYSIRDRVAKEYGPVFQAVNDGVASRSVIRLLEKIPAYDRDSFELFCVGEFDDQEGHVVEHLGYKVDYEIPSFEDVESRISNFGSVKS